MEDDLPGASPVELPVGPGAGARRLAEAIDPLRRKAAPDHLTVACAAQMLEVQVAEIERLRAALKTANSQTEHFEREWYLRGDELERLRTALHALVNALDSGHSLTIIGALTDAESVLRPNRSIP